MDRDDPTVHLTGAQRVLDAGNPILVMPEGLLAGDPGSPTSVGHFKTGAVRVAHHCDVPVWVLALVGSDEVWPRGRRFPRFGLNPFRRRHVLVLGDETLITVGGDATTDTEAVRDRMVALLGDAVELRSAALDPR